MSLQAATAEELRREASEILADRRYQGTDVPRPFESPLRWLGDRISEVWADLWSAFEDLALDIPGGSPVLGAIVVGLAILLVAALARRVITRRVTRQRLQAGERAAGAGREDPFHLEREAVEAEARGDYAAAVRLRFRAGLLRLDAQRAIEYQPSLTTGEVRAALGLPAFDRLGIAFDRIAYGGEPAGESDAEESREGWPRVLAEAGG